ncbi:dual specificity protein phosphatase [Cardiosporidium cionae]|uniref:protein-tyrosine-phosphatase n=1 Tax=Cardiosporidium cionae TaxID=476202 RepID=A0ABQ7J636_9APIC|nr:dual specificity protein phosphatase [Cardiosporidium cionae]|eukprot:KAF8819441.1 dual specificity protein phosphatase [Cardiosporidium cionae]
MNEILPFLYLGNKKDADNLNSLRMHGIRAIVMCCTVFERANFASMNEFEYYRVEVEDTSREPIHLYFVEACEFIDSFISMKEGVLVHCRAGVSRSAAIVLSYLIGKKKLRLRESFFHLLSKRHSVCPNIGFMEQLCNFEFEVLGDVSVDMFKYSDWYTSAAEFRAAVPDLEP